MRVVKPPEMLYEQPCLRPWVFLAGSIEMGKAEQWQAQLEEKLQPFHGTLWNPRRDNWDPSWDQTPDNPEFVAQVNWELDALDKADIIPMYLDPATRSPITLLELGLHASRSRQLVVCCPPGFWRKGNIEVVCKRYRIMLTHSFEEMTAEVLRRVENF